MDSSQADRVSINQLERQQQGALLPDHGDGTPTWMVGALQDVTEQKRLERTLAEADRRKSEFLALLSHELRNPLAPIRNALYLLERAEPGTAPFDRARETLARQVGHLGRLVDDLLDATRISRGMFQVHRSRLDLADLVVNVLRDHEDQFEAARITCDAQLSGEPVPVNGDTTRLAQVIGNLLSNAMKFTRPGGHVRVRLEPTPARIASLVVSDDGEGVPAELLPHLFKPFVQAGQGLSRTRGGLGLGLSVVRALVEAHGGRAWARSDGVGRGAQFAIELPMAEEEPILREPPRQSAGIPRRRVLVIEDNEDAAETLREMLVLWDQDVEVAHDGLEGLEKARTCRPDLVLCDIGLPTMSGFEVAKAIRADPVLASTYLVAVTGYATAEDRRRAADAGFDRHLGKPVPVEVVEEVVSSVPVSDAGQPLH